MKFQQSKKDPCLYVRQNGRKYTYLIVYVDDMVIACHEEGEYEEIIQNLNKHFQVVSLGDISHYSLNQQMYIQKVLTRFGMDQAKPSKYPMDPGHIQQKEEADKLTDNHQYTSLIGSLLYVAVSTLPDIAVSVSILGRSMADWTEAKRILRYLKQTMDHELVLGKTDVRGCRLGK